MSKQKDANYFRLDEPERALLRQQWHDLTRPYSDDAARRETLWQELRELYAEPHRAYHNLAHINALLLMTEDLAQHRRLQKIDAVRFAVWFHDAIYQPRRHDNEARSADLAVTALNALGVPAEIIDTVRQWILATHKHTAEGLDTDGQMFLDMDLAILGTPPETYQAYAAAIRAEYSWVPGFFYRRARRQILEGFLARPQLYFTPDFSVSREVQARANIAAELANQLSA